MPKQMFALNFGKTASVLGKLNDAISAIRRLRAERQLEYSKALCLSGAIALTGCFAFSGNSAFAQIIPDSTLGNENSTVKPITPTVDQINGGATRGANLFHSFQEFNVGNGRSVYFTNPVGIENILSRVTGSNPSNIFGKLGVNGNANLFLINPNGILFGQNASLDLRGSFVASTANRFIFADGTFFSATNPQTPPLLSINVPFGVQFGTNQPAAIVNAGSLAVNQGQNLGLIGGTVVSTGQLSAPGGQLVVVATDGLTTQGENSSATSTLNTTATLSELLTGVGDVAGLTLNTTGSVQLTGSGIPVEAGDVVVHQLNAGTATLAAAHNLTLVESQLHTTGNLNLLALDTVRVRDSVANPFLATAGGNLYIQGNKGIDILALNHPETPFQSGGNLSLVSDGIISGDAHFASGGQFQVLNLAGGAGNFVSFYDPIISALGDVNLGDYTGASLKVETTGSITIGNITITGPDTALVGSDPDIPTLNSSSALILRAGLTQLDNPPNLQQVSYFITDLGTLGGSGSVAIGINNSGQVVGVSYIASGNEHAFRTAPNSPINPLTDDLGTLGGTDSVAADINDSGQVVGFSTIAGGNEHAFRTASNSPINPLTDDLGTLGGPSIRALGINNSGQVVGFSTLANGNEHYSFRTDSNSPINPVTDDLGTLGGNLSEALRINDSGQVAGYATTASGHWHAVRIAPNSPTNVTDDLGTLGGVDSYGQDINDFGQVVGISYTARGDFHAFRTAPNSPINPLTDDLGTLGGTFSSAHGINNSGQVVGKSTTTTGNQHAFFYSDGRMQDLNNLIPSNSGWEELVHANAINDAGQIAGYGTIAGQTHPFLATPFNSSPTPATGGSITVGNITTSGIGGPVILSARDNIQTSSITTTGGSIQLTSGGIINTTAGVLDSSSISGNGGMISLTANGDITTKTLVSGSYGFGNGGNISLTSTTGTINTKAGDVLSFTNGDNDGSSKLNGGAITFSAFGDITAANLDSRGFGFANHGGDIHLTSTAGSINTEAGSLLARSRVGNAGEITLSANSNIIANYMEAYSLFANGGNITLATTNGDITLGSIDSRSLLPDGFGNGGNITLTSNSKVSVANSFIFSDTFGSGKAGDINIQATSASLTNGTQISASTHGTGKGGNLTLNASDFIELSGTSPVVVAAGTSGSGNAGNLTINTARLIVRDGASISSDTRGTGQGGNLTINSSDSVELSGTSVLTAGTYATGNARNLTINTGQLIVRDGASIASSVAQTSTGRGGNVTVNASNSVELDGTSPDGQLPSRIATATAGNGDAGNLEINTGQLIIRNGAVISTATANSGKGGNLTVNSDTVELTGTSADGQLLSALSTDTGGTGKGGDLTINTRQLTIRDGGAASSSSFSQGQGGTLTANASEFVELRGTAANGFGSGLYAQGFSSGTGGNLKVTTGDLRIFDRARITVAAGATAETRVPTSRLSGVGVHPGDRATGDAGNLEVTANRIYLNNQGRILASTDSGEGGNIQLQARDLLLMRNNSLISAEARGTGNGGNVTIDSKFIVGVNRENSDIIANAFQGNGGRVQITTQGIYGLQFRDRLTPLSDISASSEFGLDGTVQINTPGIDPSRGLTQLPENFVDSSRLIANSCIARSSRQGGSFIITGAGGLPPRPSDAFTSPYPTGTVRSLPSSSASSDAPVGSISVINPSQPRQLGEAVSTDRSRLNSQAETSLGTASNHNPTTPIPTQIVEAKGWVRGSNGEIILTTQVPTVTPYSSWSTLPTCSGLLPHNHRYS